MQDLPVAIIFDLDGTLVDNTEIVVETYATALQHLGKPVPSYDEIARLGGLSTRETAKALGLSGSLIDEMDALFWELFPKIMKTKNLDSSLLPGVSDLLLFLSSRGVKMGIVTSNTVENAQRILKATKIEKFFSVIVGYDSTDEPKPSPQPLLLAMSELSLTKDEICPDNVWFVGDSATDVQAARNANVFSVAIPHPARLSSVVDAKPDLLIGSALDLLAYLNG